MQNAKSNNKGQVLVLVALSLVVFLGFAALAIDVAYFYHTRHQLQGAADAAALAGAAELDVDKPANQQDVARQKAVEFAAKNTAAGADVIINNSGQNTEPFAAENDVTVGFWNGNSYISGETPANAVHVRARRTSDAPGGPIGTFFGKIFGVDMVNISADAIAARPGKASLNFSVCEKTCIDVPVFPSFTSINPARSMKVGTSSSQPVVADNQQVAWTNLPNQPSTNTSDIQDVICGGPNSATVCGLNLYATMGNPTSLLHALRSAFLDPNYDRSEKAREYVELTGKTQTVWYGIVPVLESCATTIQGVENDPKKIIKYAKVRIIGVCPVGNMPDPCHFGVNLLDYPDETSICRIDSNNDGKMDYAESIVIDKISCISCENQDKLYGARSFLVK